VHLLHGKLQHLAASDARVQRDDDQASDERRGVTQQSIFLAIRDAAVPLVVLMIELDRCESAFHEWGSRQEVTPDGPVHRKLEPRALQCVRRDG
jgi:hypothetical protein